MKLKLLKADIKLLTPAEAMAWCKSLGVDYSVVIDDGYQDLRNRANDA